MSASAPHPLLALYLVQLAKHPLRTKAATSAVLSLLQEVIASNAARPPPDPSAKPSNALARCHINAKAFKMALYGFFVSAPLGHVLVGLLQRAFADKVGLRFRLGQLLASNLLVAPVQTAAFLASMAVINGAKSAEEVVRTVKAGFFAVIRVNWIVSPLSMVIAQQFIPVELWVPFFNMIQFALGTFFNVRMKKLRLAATRKEQEQNERERASAAAAKAE